jgi:hypothetical protein
VLDATSVGVRERGCAVVLDSELGCRLPTCPYAA